MLTTDARVDLWSCSVAAGPLGRFFVNELAADTGAAVFASDNPVGTVPGADLCWDYHTGHLTAKDDVFSVQQIAAIPGLCLQSMSATYYGSPNNTFASNANVGQCTWYVYGRMQETGLESAATLSSLQSHGLFTGNANQWYSEVVNNSSVAAAAGITVGSQSKPDAIACYWTKFTHVAFVENSSGQMTESNLNPTTSYNAGYTAVVIDGYVGYPYVKLHQSDSTSSTVTWQIPQLTVMYLTGQPYYDGTYQWYPMSAEDGNASHTGWAALLDANSGGAVPPGSTDVTLNFTGIQLSPGTPWITSAPDGYIYLNSAAPLSGPTITSPGTSTDTGSTVSSLTPTMYWNGVSGASDYGLYISQYPYGSSNIIYSNSSLSGTSTNFVLPSGTLSYGVKYCWNMNTENSSGTWGSVGNTLYFQTPAPPLSGPTITSPGTSTDTGSTVSSLTPTMYWNGVSGASDYGLYISQYPYGSSNIIYSNSSLSGTSTNFVLPSGTLSYGVKYCWNMNTENSSGTWGSVGNTLYFQTPTAPLLGPTITSPGTSTDTGSTVSSLTPTMYWNGVSGASDYGLYISQYPYGSSNIIYSNSSLSGTSTNFVLPSGTLSYGVKYCWNMNTENSSGTWGSVGNTLYFQTPAPPLSGPTITSPGTSTDTGSTVSSLTPTMYWNGVSGASDYGLYISQYPYGSSNIIYSNSSLSGTSTNFVLPSGTLSYGVKYCWNMNTENSSGTWGSVGNTLYFQTPAPPLSGPTITSPGTSTGTGSTVSSLTPTMYWNGVSGASEYGLYISQYPYGSSNIIYSNSSLSGTSTNFVLPSGTLSYGVKYCWNMNTENSSGTWGSVGNTLYFQTPAPISYTYGADFDADATAANWSQETAGGRVSCSSRRHKAETQTLSCPQICCLHHHFKYLHFWPLRLCRSRRVREFLA